ncbi:MAG: tetratricopeptide repeat protein [Kiritimatiellae bacterium]|nr:tetratricopeptide repeat protein [Kiritimatiellia bacterium]
MRNSTAPGAAALVAGLLGVSGCLTGRSPIAPESAGGVTPALLSDMGSLAMAERLGDMDMIAAAHQPWLDLGLSPPAPRINWLRLAATADVTTLDAIRAHVRNLARQYPSTPDPWVYLARLEYLESRFLSAARAMEEAVARASERPLLHAECANAWMHAGDYDRAWTALERAPWGSEQTGLGALLAASEAWGGRMLRERSAGVEDRLTKLWQMAAERRPEDARFRSAVAGILGRLEFPDAAMDWHHEAIRTRPEDVAGYQMALDFLHEQGRSEEVRALAREGLDRARQPIPLRLWYADWLTLQAETPDAGADAVAADLTDAARLLGTVRHALPRESHVMARLGYVCARLGRAAEAVEAWSRWGERDDAAIRHTLADMVLETADPADAADELERSRAGDPIWRGYARAEALERAGRTAEAGATWEALVASAPAESSLRFRRAVHAARYAETGRADELISSDLTALPGDPLLVGLDAVRRIVEGDMAGARAVLDTIPAFHRSEPPAFMGVSEIPALLRWFEGRPDEAYAEVRERLQREGEWGGTLELAKELRRRVEGRNSLLPWTARAMMDFAEHPRLAEEHGWQCTAENNFPEALRAFHEARRRWARTRGGERRRGAMDFFIAMQQEQLGNWGEAERGLRAIVGSNPDDALALNALAFALAERSENLDEALDLIQRALRIRPGDAAYLDTRGWVLYRLGRIEEARQDLLAAMGKDPDEAEILDHLADVELTAGRREESERYRREAFLRDPDFPGLRERALAQGLRPDEWMTDALAWRERWRRRLDFLLPLLIPHGLGDEDGLDGLLR